MSLPRVEGNTSNASTIDSMPYGQSVYQRASSFARKSRRPTTPVEELLSGKAADRSRDISIYDDSNESSFLSEVRMNRLEEQQEQEDHNEALQWTTAATPLLPTAPETTTPSSGPAVDIVDEGGSSSSSFAPEMIASNEEDSTGGPDPKFVVVASCESPNLSPIHKTTKHENLVVTPETLPCSPDGGNSERMIPNFSLPISDTSERSGDSPVSSSPASLQSSLLVRACSLSDDTADKDDDNTSRQHDDAIQRNKKKAAACDVSSDTQPHDNTNETWVSESIDSDPRIVLFDGIIYQHAGDSIAILTLVESKRQCWFQNELQSTRTEWQYYRKWLNDSVREVSKVEELIANSHVSLVQYTQRLTELANASPTTPIQHVLHRRHRNKLKVLQNGETELKGVLMDSYRTVQDVLEEKVPAMTECVRNATVFKQFITLKAEDLAGRGELIRMDDVEMAEETTQEAFCVLMDILNEYEGGCSYEQIRSDRWIAEASYRMASRKAMSLWKTRRRQLQVIYKEIIRLDQKRKTQQQDLLRVFLPLRKEMLSYTRDAFGLGIGRLHAQAKQVVVKYDEFPDIGNSTKVALTANNAYVKEYRFLDLKTSTGWQPALVVVTQDEELHIFSNYRHGHSMDDVAAMLRTKQQPFLVSMNPRHYEVSRPSSMEIELLRPGRSKLFRKRDDYCVFRLQSEYETVKWYSYLRELTESGIHC